MNSLVKFSMKFKEQVAFQFLRYSLGISVDFAWNLSEHDWAVLHRWAEKQFLLGIFFVGVQKLSQKQKLPQRLALRWAMEAEHIRGLNRKINETTVELSRLFEKFGCRAITLKGAANALLYPDSSLRQTGDIDLFVPGGRETVVELLKRANLKKCSVLNSYHAEFQYKGEEVEIHYIATSQNSPQKNKFLQMYLSQEEKKSQLSPMGFFVPSTCYALMMQLGHIEQHFFRGGVGLRQLVDYYQLLMNSTVEDRNRVSARLKSCGLDKMAGAIMWTLREVLCLNEKNMLCQPNKSRGKLLLKVILEGGNFGWYAEDYRQSVFARWFKDRIRFVKLLNFDASEALWGEIHYWIDTISLIPRRIKSGRLALGKR